MAPSVVTNRKQYKLYENINAKKLNRSLVNNVKLHKRIATLSTQNKELSITLNNLLLHKIKIENENNSIKNESIQLNAMNIAFHNRLNVLEQTLQKCVPALVTLSECIPSMMETVHEMSKFDKIIELKKTEKKQVQTKTVRPMINGLTITQPAVNVRRCDMSPIIESPRSEQSPTQTMKSSSRSLPKCKLTLEPYVRLKDVAVMFKNSKAVPNTDAAKRQQDDNLGEGPSWLHEPQNSDNNNSTTENYENSPQVLNETITPKRETTLQNYENSPQVLNEIITPKRETTLMFNEVQTDVSQATSILNGDMSNSMSNKTDISHISLTSSTESSMLRNITCRKPQKRRSNETSVLTDIDLSITSSTRSRRSTKKRVNYQEPTLNTKLRRN